MFVYQSLRARVVSGHCPQQLKRVIDQTIVESDNFDDFLAKLRDKSVEVVYTPEKTIKIKFRLPDQQRYARGKTLGWRRVAADNYAP